MAGVYRQDGGWALAVLFAALLTHVIVMGMTFSFGIYFVILKDDLETSHTTTLWIGALNTSLVFIGGPLASVMLNRYGCRFTIILGGLLSAAGYISSYFATKPYHLGISYGIVTGLGFGLSYTPCVVMVGRYYKKWLYLATAAACTGEGLGFVLFPMIFNNLIEEYQWQGSMLINGAISLNIVLCGVIMKPLKAKEENADVLNLTMFKDLKMMLFALSMVCWNIGVVIVSFIVADFLVERGIELRKGIYLLTIMGIANMVGHPFAGLTVFCRKWPYANLWLYTITIAITGTVVMLFNTGESFSAFVVYGIVSSLALGVQLGCLANVVIDLFGIDVFNHSFGYQMASQGVGNLIGPPIAGILREKTKNYAVPFYFGGIVTIFSAVIMVVIFGMVKAQKRRESSGREENETVQMNLVGNQDAATTL
ncbi:PREDICTED: monocarboxylate transporter 6-like isoform X2 [Priapulus caudatus]|nr:PREDICTED: monocarboxylate transporter 6-like isoform X2 [Priapulus caudatus]